MAKTVPVASKRQTNTGARSRGLKRLSKKKAPKIPIIPKVGVLGMVNGFTVTRLEPEKLQTLLIFPPGLTSPANEPKRVTFAPAELQEEINGNARPHRANTRRTHSARDSSEDSLNDFDASREAKRRRTSELSTVEDAEVRKTTSSMRPRKVTLQHSTPAEIKDENSPTLKREYPRTPKPTEKSAVSSFDTFDETSHHEGDDDDEEEECTIEAKVTLERLFDDDTNAEEGEHHREGEKVLSASKVCPAVIFFEDRNSLNSSGTTVEIDVDKNRDNALAPKDDEQSSSSETHDFKDFHPLSPVRIDLKEINYVPPVIRDKRAAEEIVDTQESETKDDDINSDLSLNLAPDSEAGQPQPSDDQNEEEPPKGESADNLSSLDERSLSRLTSRNSQREDVAEEEKDVFHQRRSQLSLDEEEPMEVSIIQNSTRLSGVPTPKAEARIEVSTDTTDAVSQADGVGSGLESKEEYSGIPAEGPREENTAPPATTVDVEPKAEAESTEAVPEGKIMDTSTTLSLNFTEEEDIDMRSLSDRIKKIPEQLESFVTTPDVNGDSQEPVTEPKINEAAPSAAGSNLSVDGAEDESPPEGIESAAPIEGEPPGAEGTHLKPHANDAASDEIPSDEQHTEAPPGVVMEEATVEGQPEESRAAATEEVSDQTSDPQSAEAVGVTTEPNAPVEIGTSSKGTGIEIKDDEPRSEEIAQEEEIREEELDGSERSEDRESDESSTRVTDEIENSNPEPQNFSANSIQSAAQPSERRDAHDGIQSTIDSADDSCTSTGIDGKNAPAAHQSIETSLALEENDPESIPELDREGPPASEPLTEADSKQTSKRVRRSRQPFIFEADSGPVPVTTPVVKKRPGRAKTVEKSTPGAEAPKSTRETATKSTLRSSAEPKTPKTPSARTKAARSMAAESESSEAVAEAAGSPEEPVAAPKVTRTPSARSKAAKTAAAAAAKLEASRAEADDGGTPETSPVVMKTPKTPAPKAKTPRAKATKAMSSKKETEAPKTPEGSPVTIKAPKTPKSKASAPRTTRTPAATPSKKTAKSKSISPEDDDSPPEVSRSAVKTSKTSTTASTSRRKTTK
ncbi:serine/arginine repetitive matrix protein 2 [Galendromus occidentalis]|uniref:Serine/arginine repetitive matrix protein 2 n=1 Tax=Galendromus occidentalis TaxID=34638 RepID=A0AAJ6QVL4_9ACAR|nr:serine/arginine repetitive matrix protein 2 [Galendromus occidentalis]